MSKLLKNSKTKTPKDYENLGRIVASIYETGYLDRRQTYKMSFIKGALSGFGGVLGATVLIAFLLWILSFFSSVPLIGHFTSQIDHTVNQSQTSK